MIRRIFSHDELSGLPQKGIEAQKIRALLFAYGTGYDFCRFFVSEDFILCETDGSFIVCETGNTDTISELSDFIKFNGFTEIFCSERMGEIIAKKLECTANKVNLMRFCGKSVICDGVDCEPPLDGVFSILSSSFELDYSRWYTDMSHRIRHGVAKARCLDNSALIVQHDLNGEALLSQIATLPEHRGKGNASRLILAVCKELSGSDVFVICDDDLLNFYSKLGFEKVSNKFIIFKQREC